MIRNHVSAIAAVAAVALVISACSFSPLAHRIKIGEEPFVVFTGEGIDGHTDLFAIEAAGGAVSQFTFTPLIEHGPRLTPGGDVVAFIRMRDTMPDTHRQVVMMNLLAGSDLGIDIPPAAGRPLAVAWSDSGTKLYVRADHGVWQVTPPPGPQVVTQLTGADSVVADSALDSWVGSPRFARVVGCAAGGLCVIGPKRDTTPLAPNGHDMIRWGKDSVAWFETDGIVVRSLGPGHERRIHWTDGPKNPRDGSYAGLAGN